METHQGSTQNLLMKVLSKIRTIAANNSVARKAAESFGVKVFSLGISFITNICLPRTLGATGYRDYIYAINRTSFLGVPACLGLREYLAREVALYNAKAEWKTLVQLYALGDLVPIEQVSARLLQVSCSAICATLIAVEYWFLLIFGEESVQDQMALVILCCGYMLASFEIAGLLLLMTGRARDTAIETGITAMLNVILNALLIPKFGLEGASFATATSIVARGLFFSFHIYQTLGIIPNPLKFSKARQPSANDEITAESVQLERSATVLRVLKQFPVQLKRHRQIKRRYRGLSIATLLKYDDIEAIKVASGVSVGAFSEIVVANSVSDRSHQRRLAIAGGTAISSQARLLALGEKIFIRQNCRLADQVSLMTTRDAEDQPLRIEPELGIYLDDNVWLGTEVTVRQVCTNGENSVVAAGSVVNENIPKNEVWAGVPAKKVRDKAAEIATLMEAQ